MVTQPLLALKPTSLPAYITGFLEINTGVIVHNYRNLHSMLDKSTCSAVLKADAYGFGIKEIAPILKQEGCSSFFVAHLEEGLFLRNLLKESTIYILSGILPGTENLFVEENLTPVLNNFEMVKLWTQEAQKREKKLPCVLHFDTGMRRNGFDQKDLAHLFDSLQELKILDVQLVMSHLVSSHDAKDPLNHQQWDLFETLRCHFPHAKASLADTGGIYLGQDFHYDVVRPGKGLFGFFTPPHNEAPLNPCLKLFGRVLQIRTAHKGESVGYGATYILGRESKLATIGVGFADGYDRRLSNMGHVEFQGFKAPITGRISMDYTVVDVTDVPETLCYPGGWTELVNDTLTLDNLAHTIGTISRELSTGFSKRLMRIYK